MTREEFLKTFPELVKNYQSAPEVLHQIGQISLLMIIGPSGVGKTTLINRLGYRFVPSDTTRDPRPGEQNGVDFYFRTDYAQVISDIKMGRFVQTAVGPGGDFYATRASSYPESGLAVMPVVADVVPIFRNLGFEATISAFIVPPSYEEWMRRMHSHPITDEQLAKRFNEAERSFSFALTDPEVNFVLNDDIDEATNQLKNLVNGKTDQEREQRAREIAKSLLTQLI